MKDNDIKQLLVNSLLLTTQCGFSFKDCTVDTNGLDYINIQTPDGREFEVSINKLVRLGATA